MNRIRSLTVRSAISLSRHLGRARHSGRLDKNERLDALATQSALKREIRAADSNAVLRSPWIDRAEQILTQVPDELLAYLASLAPADVGFDATALVAIAERRTNDDETRKRVRSFFWALVDCVASTPLAEVSRPFLMLDDPNRVPPPPPRRPAQETVSQRRAREFITKLGRLYFGGVDFGLAIEPRLFPLLVGPTGVGKSHLVATVAKSFGAGYLRLTYGDWIPYGAKDRKDTRTVILEALLADERVVLHIDELDKWPLSDSGAASWLTAASNDLWAVLDKQLSPEKFLAEHPDVDAGRLSRKIQRNMWIVGSGTWQQVFEDDRGMRHMGFGSSAPAEADVGRELAGRIRESRQISPELLARFNTSLQVLTYPSVGETAQLLRKTGISALAARVGVSIRPQDVDYRQGGMRVLESLASSLLVREMSL